MHLISQLLGRTVLLIEQTKYLKLTLVSSESQSLIKNWWNSQKLTFSGNWKMIENLHRLSSALLIMPNIMYLKIYLFHMTYFYCIFRIWTINEWRELQHFFGTFIVKFCHCEKGFIFLLHSVSCLKEHIPYLSYFHSKFSSRMWAGIHLK